jgi:2-polyprenyl-6-methoxyphenol hydroxylase-like FAD-dependent oxidoreductase
MAKGIEHLIKYNTSVVGIENKLDSVSVTLDDGTVEHGTILVGADGGKPSAAE